MTPTRTLNAPHRVVTSLTATSGVNGAAVPTPDLEALLHAVDEFRGNRRRLRTNTAIEMMREKGFDPDRDLCFINDGLRTAFNDHPCFRWSPYVKDMCFLSHRLWA